MMSSIFSSRLTAIWNLIKFLASQFFYVKTVIKNPSLMIKSTKQMQLVSIQNYINFIIFLSKLYSSTDFCFESDQTQWLALKHPNNYSIYTQETCLFLLSWMCHEWWVLNWGLDHQPHSLAIPFLRSRLLLSPSKRSNDVTVSKFLCTGMYVHYICLQLFFKKQT